MPVNQLPLHDLNGYTAHSNRPPAPPHRGRANLAKVFARAGVLRHRIATAISVICRSPAAMGGSGGQSPLALSTRQRPLFCQPPCEKGGQSDVRCAGNMAQFMFSKDQKRTGQGRPGSVSTAVSTIFFLSAQPQPMNGASSATLCFPAKPLAPAPGPAPTHGGRSAGAAPLSLSLPILGSRPGRQTGAGGLTGLFFPTTPVYRKTDAGPN